MTLEVGDIHGWFRATDARQIDVYQSLLSADERTRCARFHFARDRHDYANAHHLLRETLSRYGRRAPRDWQFAVADHGKPVLAPGISGPDGAVALTFNLTHTRALSACGFGRGTPVGIDVERADRLRDVMPLAKRFFSPAEVVELNACFNRRRTRRFVELWTLKEAFIKAIGRGLAQPLDSFTFDLREDGAIRFTPPEEFIVTEWQFAQYEVAPDVFLAIAAGTMSMSKFVVRGLDGDRMFEIAPTRVTTSERRTRSIGAL